MTGATPAADRTPTILALGGHEFSRKRGDEALRDYMLTLVDSARPRVCMLPTASGDPAAQIASFRHSFGALDCELSAVSLFRLENEPTNVARHLLDQDLIYVGGGSMVNLLAVWRAHGVDSILGSCWERGVVLVGQSAGAMCWFEWGVTRSAGTTRLAPGLGLIPGVLSVHYHRDPDRRQVLLAEVARRGQPGFAVDDGAGLVVRGTRVVAAVSGRARARAWRVLPDGKGRAVEAELGAAPLPSPRPAIDEAVDDVIEMRRLRAVRAAHRKIRQPAR